MGLQIRGIFLNYLIILYFICYKMFSRLENIFVSVMMATTLKFTTVNVAGMHIPERRMQIFKHLLQQGHDIIALQETHCENNDIKLWEKEWNGFSKWNPYSSKKAGVAILFHPKLKVELLDMQMDFNGRVIQLTVKIYNCTFQILNIYVPNPERQEATESFINDAQYYLDPTLPALMCGDFNMVENLKLDRQGGNPRSIHLHGKESLEHIKKENCLVDIWREKHLTKKQFTWHCRYDNISSRVDRIYINSAWTSEVQNSYIHPFIWSDHDMCTINFYLPQQIKRGRGIWKMNLSHINDENFQTKIKDFWLEWKNEKINYEDNGVWWDIGKSYIKRIAINFSIGKQREINSIRKKVMDQIQIEQEKTTQNQEIISELITELKRIDIENQKKIFISAHNEVIEPGERPSKYFFNQLKSNQTKHAMSTLRNGEGELLTDQGDILLETVNYYTKLYTEEENLEKHEQIKFLNNIHRKLTEQGKQELEAQLTEKELLDALSDTENEKTPGCDGIPYEFYKEFWPTIGKDLHEAFMYNLNNKQALSVSQRTSIIALLFKGSDNQLLKNWRPISLLCTDYKILSKALANHIKKKLHMVLNPEQTCSVPERTIFQNLFLTQDIINYCNQKNINGYILTVD